MVRQKGNRNLAYYKNVHMGMALWESDGYIKVGHIVAHQKTLLPGLGGGWNQQADICMCLMCLPESMQLVDIQCLQQNRDGLNLDIFFLNILRHKFQ